MAAPFSRRAPEKGVTTPDLDRFESRRSTVYGQRGVVATSQPLAAQAGVQILAEGGNAFDAAVATAAALNVVEPTSTGIGGDVFALYRTASGDVGGLRACGGAPDAATPTRVREQIAETEDSDPEAVTMPFHGPHTVTVPGTARGWELTAAELGTKSLQELLQPAIRYAKDGYPVTEYIANAWEHGEQLFESTNARDAYLFDGEAPTVGQRVTLPQLGDSLETIANEGADVVYEGEIADAIVEEIQAHGGLMTHEDLAAFEPEFVEPVSTRYNGAEVYELPPNNQGLIALEALNIAAEVDAGGYPYESVERLHYFIEAMKRAFHDGHHYITDPTYEEIPPLESDAWAKKRATGIDETASNDVDIGGKTAPAEDADTVLLTVADEAGNVVSYINSRYAGFGSGLVAGETGIALQNRGASFSLDPEDPNVIAPGKRPFHTLIPAVVDFAPEKDADDWAAFGVMGGYMQPQGHVQIISNIVDYDMPLQAALDEPRWRYRESGTVAIEERLDAHQRLGTKLLRRGHDTGLLYPSLFGGAQIVRNQDGVLSAATEPRKDGVAIGL